MPSDPTLSIGTSGWHYDHWRGPFYPEGLSKRQWLGFYSARFRCVEVNNTFYGSPSDATVAGWVEQTPSDFVFALKASRYITHRKKLKDSAAEVERFVDEARRFGSKLGPILFQLPPRLAYTGSYDRADLEAWACQVRSWRENGHDVLVFFDNDDQGFAVGNALGLVELTLDGC